MKEKLLWFAVVILGAMLATSRAQSPMPNTAGRFQLFMFERETGRSKGPVVFRIDTQTGEVSTYHEGFLLPSETPDKKDYRFSFWGKIDEQWTMYDAVEEARRARKQ